ncbi:MAG: MFS transporter [Rhodospirillaceae bacterium]|jgi:glycoside/pentoside/hexuronide:cation symporter, GPH family|nr:MFS transporter [Rhodospirillaceae bacterium]MBT5565584.1 MFS transporter [Rhodospirillaceae bacterium]MBT6088353.1 MFS transporter [Rhodospirillaceae bacterium]MBT6962211.1 MFS transporter [Rhodospirillaceae bacterium]
MSDLTPETAATAGVSSGDPERPLSLKVCMGWGVGSLGMAVMFGLISTFALSFMTNYLAISAGVAGALLGLSKIYDAVTDPLMGVISDRTGGSIGRRRPYLLAGAFMLAATMVLMFNVPDFATPTGAAIYMTAMLLLYATAYTVFNVPYLAMPAEMTEGYHERAYLMSFRVYGIAGAGYVGYFGGPIIIDYFGGGRAGFEGMAWVMGAAVLASSVACYYFTKDAPFKHKVDSAPVGFKAQVRLIMQNRPFLWLMLAKMFGLLGQALSNPAKAFFFPLVLGASLSSFGWYWFAFYTAMTVSQTFWLKLGKSHGKRDIFIAALLLTVCINLTWLLATPAEAFGVTLLRGVALGFLGGATLLMGQAMLPDTMEYDLRITGLRREGVYAGVYTTIEKLAFAFGPAITGIVLAAMGYVASSDGIAEQPDSAILAVYICAAGLPAITGLLAALSLLGYDLTEEKLKATKAVDVASEGAQITAR